MRSPEARKEPSEALASLAKLWSPCSTERSSERGRKAGKPCQGMERSLFAVRSSRARTAVLLDAAACQAP